jgi:hypothetical protein
MICPNCGGENREDYKFCGHCGAPRPATPVVQGTVIVPEAPTFPAPPPPAIPQPRAEARMPYTPDPGVAAPKRKSRGLITCLIIFLVLGCLAVAALVAVALLKPEWLPFDIPFLSRNNSLIIGFPNRDGETDLYLLRQGQTIDQGILLAENALATSVNFYYQENNTIRTLADYMYPFGAFVPRQNYLLYWYMNDDGQIILGRMMVNQEKPSVIYEENAVSMLGVILPNMQDLFLEEIEEEHRCYLSIAGGSANDILRGSYCDLTYDLSTAFAVDQKDAETTVELFTLADNAAFTPLDDQENVGEVRFSGDGLRLSYVDTTEIPHVVYLDSQDGSTLVTGPDAYAVVQQGFAWRGHIGYFISENDDGNLELYLLSDAGTTLVRTDLSIGAGLSLDGARLVYTAGPIDGEQTLYVRDVASGTDTEVVSGNNLQFTILDPLSSIIITSENDDQLMVYSANLEGSGLVSLFEGDNFFLSELVYVPGQPYIFLVLDGEDGLSLLATRPDLEDEYMVVEDWNVVDLLDLSGDGNQLLYIGAEEPDDDIALYLANLDTKDSITLDDDAEDIGNGLFSARDDTVLYTAITGDNPDDAEVRSLRLGRSDPSMVLYSDAVLVAAQWDTLAPFSFTSFTSPQQSSSYCPGAFRLTQGASQDANLEAGARDCYSYRGAANETLTFWVEGEAGFDTALTVYNRQGNYIDSDDYGLNGTDPRLIVTLPEDGIYYIEVSSYNETAGAYTLSNSEGANYCPGVEQLAVGEMLQSQMNEDGQVYFGFSGNANTDYTFWIESTGMDPMLSLYDAEGYMLTSDDNSRDGVDPLVITTLPETGNYCLAVNTFGFETGAFSVSMHEGSVFCPDAQTLRLDQEVTGSVNQGRGTCYSVNVTSGTTYSFVVNSPTGTDTVLELYDATGNILTRDDDGGGYPNPLLTYTFDQSGTYYIMIRGFSTGSTGNYELNFTEGTGFCANAQPIFLGDTVTGFVPANMEVCYSFEGYNGQTVLFNVDSPIDTVLVLYDESGYEVAYNDDGGEGLNPRIQTALPADGTYYIAIHGYGNASGDYSLSFSAGGEISDPFANAIYLPANSRIRGSIRETDLIYLPDYDFTTYGQIYYFDGVAGQNIRIDAYGDTLGSQIDTWLVLFDQYGEYLFDDDDGGVAGYDSRLDFTLPTTGRYYVLISDLASEYGVGDSYFYDLLLTYR